MNKTIYKYKLNILELTEIEDSIRKPLCVQYQHSSNSICLWALVDTDFPKQKYVVGCYGTGHEVDPLFFGSDYIGTVQTLDGQMVLHYFMTSTDELRERRKNLEDEISPELEMEIN